MPGLGSVPTPLKTQPKPPVPRYPPVPSSCLPSPVVTTTFSTTDAVPPAAVGSRALLEGATGFANTPLHHSNADAVGRVGWQPWQPPPHVANSFYVGMVNWWIGNYNSALEQAAGTTSSRKYVIVGE